MPVRVNQGSLFFQMFCLSRLVFYVVLDLLCSNHFAKQLASRTVSE